MALAAHLSTVALAARAAVVVGLAVVAAAHCRHGFDVLFTLCSQHKPCVSHEKQFALGFEAMEGSRKPQAFFGVQPIPFYEIWHARQVPTQNPSE